MSSGSSLRFSLSPDEAGRILGRKKLAGRRLKKNSASRISEVYFDTPGFSFYKSGVSLCIESGNGLRRQTMRQIGRGPDWMRPTRSWSSELEPCQPAFVSSGGAPVKTAFQEIFSSSRERQEMKLKGDGPSVSLSIEQGQIETAIDGSDPSLEEVCEIELTCDAEDNRMIFEIALELLETTNFRLQPRSIASRGLVLAGEMSGLKHVKVQKIVLDPAMSIGEALQISCRNIMEHLLQNEAAALAGHPDGIHQTRVAMRRFRAALRAFKKALPYESRKAYNGEFRWFQQTSGPARDWHVFTDETLPRLGKDAFESAEADRLARIAEERRHEHSREAAEILLSRRYTRLLLRFGHWLAELSRDKSPRLEQPVEPFARKAITKAHRDLLTGISDVREGVLEDMHGIRIKAKKARYAVEFFRSLFDADATKAYLRLMKDMQEKLGEANDARVARTLMAEIGPDRLDPQTFETVHTWAAVRIDECLRLAHPGLEALKAEPFRLGNGGTSAG